MEPENKEDLWLMKVDSGLTAHWKEGDCESRPGTFWVIDLNKGDKECRIFVKGLLADEATEATIADTDYQARVALQYVNDRLNQGMNPEEETEHEIYITNPN